MPFGTSASYSVPGTPGTGGFGTASPGGIGQQMGMSASARAQALAKGLSSGVAGKAGSSFWKKALRVGGWGLAAWTVIDLLRSLGSISGNEELKASISAAGLGSLVQGPLVEQQLRMQADHLGSQVFAAEQGRSNDLAGLSAELEGLISPTDRDMLGQIAMAEQPNQVGAMLDEMLVK